MLPSNASVKNLPMTSFAYRASGGKFLSDAGMVIFIGVAMQPEAIVAATLAVSQEQKGFTTNHTSILKIVRFNAQNVAQFDA